MTCSYVSWLIGVVQRYYEWWKDPIASYIGANSGSVVVSRVYVFMCCRGVRDNFFEQRVIVEGVIYLQVDVFMLQMFL